ncbi:MAG TPA: hypothetical protein VMF67_15940, partial [Rhizomicrobium sp.]|nr:hypothetical protein [Rhizomicrobium sp.]
MTDSVSVKISADIADLQDQFALAESAISDLADALNKLGEQGEAGGLADQLKAQLDVVSPQKAQQDANR